MREFIIICFAAAVSLLIASIIMHTKAGKAKTYTFDKRTFPDGKKEVSIEKNSTEVADGCDENLHQEGSAMIITTTHNIEGHTIAEYLGIVCGAAITATTGGNKMALFGWKNGVHGAMSTIENEARAIGADAVIGVQSVYINSALCLMGTAVRLK